MSGELRDRLRELRRGKKLSQAELATLVGLHYTQIGRYERGLSLPASDTLKRMADVFEVAVDYLVGGDPGDAARTRLEDRELLRLFEAVQGLPASDRGVVMALIDAFVKKRQLEAILGR